MGKCINIFEDFDNAFSEGKINDNFSFEGEEDNVAKIAVDFSKLDANGEKIIASEASLRLSRPNLPSSKARQISGLETLSAEVAAESEISASDALDIAGTLIIPAVVVPLMLQAQKMNGTLNSITMLADFVGVIPEVGPFLQWALMSYYIGKQKNISDAEKAQDIIGMVCAATALTWMQEIEGIDQGKNLVKELQAYGHHESDNIMTKLFRARAALYKKMIQEMITTGTFTAKIDVNRSTNLRPGTNLSTILFPPFSNLLATKAQGSCANYFSQLQQAQQIMDTVEITGADDPFLRTKIGFLQGAEKYSSVMDDAYNAKAYELLKSEYLAVIDEICSKTLRFLDPKQNNTGELPKNDALEKNPFATKSYDPADDHLYKHFTQRENALSYYQSEAWGLYTTGRMAAGTSKLLAAHIKALPAIYGFEFLCEMRLHRAMYVAFIVDFDKELAKKFDSEIHDFIHKYRSNLMSLILSNVFTFGGIWLLTANENEFVKDLKKLYKVETFLTSVAAEKSIKEFYDKCLKQYPVDVGTHKYNFDNDNDISKYQIGNFDSSIHYVNSAVSVAETFRSLLSDIEKYQPSKTPPTRSISPQISSAVCQRIPMVAQLKSSKDGKIAVESKEDTADTPIQPAYLYDVFVTPEQKEQSPIQAAHEVANVLCHGNSLFIAEQGDRLQEQYYPNPKNPIAGATEIKDDKAHNGLCDVLRQTSLFDADFFQAQLKEHAPAPTKDKPNYSIDLDVLYQKLVRCQRFVADDGKAHGFFIAQDAITGAVPPDFYKFVEDDCVVVFYDKDFREIPCFDDGSNCSRIFKMRHGAGGESEVVDAKNMFFCKKNYVIDKSLVNQIALYGGPLGSQPIYEVGPSSFPSFALSENEFWGPVVLDTKDKDANSDDNGDDSKDDDDKSKDASDDNKGKDDKDNSSKDKLPEPEYVALVKVQWYLDDAAKKAVVDKYVNQGQSVNFLLDTQKKQQDVLDYRLHSIEMVDDTGKPSDKMARVRFFSKDYLNNRYSAFYSFVYRANAGGKAISNASNQHAYDSVIKAAEAEGVSVDEQKKAAIKTMDSEYYYVPAILIPPWITKHAKWGRSAFAPDFTDIQIGYDYDAKGRDAYGDFSVCYQWADNLTINNTSVHDIYSKYPLAWNNPFGSMPCTVPDEILVSAASPEQALFDLLAGSDDNGKSNLLPFGSLAALLKVMQDVILHLQSCKALKDAKCPYSVINTAIAADAELAQIDKTLTNQFQRFLSINSSSFLPIPSDATPPNPYSLVDAKITYGDYSKTVSGTLCQDLTAPGTVTLRLEQEVVDALENGDKIKIVSVSINPDKEKQKKVNSDIEITSDGKIKVLKGGLTLDEVNLFQPATLPIAPDQLTADDLKGFASETLVTGKSFGSEHYVLLLAPSLLYALSKIFSIPFEEIDVKVQYAKTGFDAKWLYKEKE